MKTLMIYKQNPETNDWLCYIPETSQAYYVRTKSQAVKFCTQVNQGFELGLIYFNDRGNLCKKDI